MPCTEKCFFFGFWQNQIQKSEWKVFVQTPFLGPSFLSNAPRKFPKCPMTTFKVLERSTQHCSLRQLKNIRDILNPYQNIFTKTKKKPWFYYTGISIVKSSNPRKLSVQEKTRFFSIVSKIMSFWFFHVVETVLDSVIIVLFKMFWITLIWHVLLEEIWFLSALSL